MVLEKVIVEEENGELVETTQIYKENLLVKTKLLGLQQEEDLLTKMLNNNNKDLIKAKQQRMVLFDAHGPIIEEAKPDDSDEEEDKESERSSEIDERSEKDLLDELR